MDLIARTTLYGQSPLNREDRILVFPDLDTRQAEHRYYQFIGQHKLPNLAFPALPCIGADEGIEREYTSALILLASFVEDPSGRIKHSDEDLCRIRNEHLDQFVDYLASQSVAVAERLPIGWSEQQELRLLELQAMDRD